MRKMHVHLLGANAFLFDKICHTLAGQTAHLVFLDGSPRKKNSLWEGEPKC